MVVTEQALMDFKVATQVTEVLEKEGLDVFVFAKCQADAPSAICDEELRSTEKKEQMALWQ